MFAKVLKRKLELAAFRSQSCILSQRSPRHESRNLISCSTRTTTHPEFDGKNQIEKEDIMVK
jgi:hypothetical protein